MCMVIQKYMVFLTYAVTQISTAMQKFLTEQGVLAMQKSMVMQKFFCKKVMNLFGYFKYFSYLCITKPIKQ